MLLEIRRPDEGVSSLPAWVKLMKSRRTENTRKSSSASTLVQPYLVEKPAIFVDAERATEAAQWLNKRHDEPQPAIKLAKGSLERLNKMLARRDRKYAKLREKAAKRFGTFTSWERDGMSGGHSTPPVPEKPRRKPGPKTLEVLRTCSKLKGRSLTKQLAQYHPPDWPEERLRAWWNNLKSRHKKYIPSN